MYLMVVVFWAVSTHFQRMCGVIKYTLNLIMYMLYNLESLYNPVTDYMIPGYCISRFVIITISISIANSIIYKKIFKCSSDDSYSNFMQNILVIDAINDLSLMAYIS